MKDEPPLPPDPPPRPLALTPRALPPGVEVRPFPGFGAEPAPLEVAGPGVAGEGGLLRAAATFGGSLFAGLALTTFFVVPTRTAGAPRSVRLERDARRRGQAIEVRDALRVREPQERRGAGLDDL